MAFSWIGERLFLGRGIGSAIALTTVAFVSPWTNNVKAGVIDALAIFTIFVFGARNSSTRMSGGIDTLPIVTGLSRGTLRTWIFDAFSIFTGRALVTVDVRTTFDTFSVAAEKTVFASHISTGVANAFSCFTTL